MVVARRLVLPGALGVLLLPALSCQPERRPPSADGATLADSTLADTPTDGPVTVDLDPGIRCNDPGVDPVTGVPFCGRCVRPDGTPVGCARCPDGADAGGQSLC
ncbi:MAG: hypothetical protein HY909_22135 [Deltaproteobacteria bacterium]|nr:hypothetical protein [Deltaproteobacteria bacterium]